MSFYTDPKFTPVRGAIVGGAGAYLARNILNDHIANGGKVTSGGEFFAHGDIELVIASGALGGAMLYALVSLLARKS